MLHSAQRKSIWTRLASLAGLVSFLLASHGVVVSPTTQPPALNKAGYAYLEQELSPHLQSPSRMKSIVRHAAYAAGACASGAVAALACNYVAPMISPSYKESVVSRSNAERLSKMVALREQIVRSIDALGIQLEELSDTMCSPKKSICSRMSVPLDRFDGQTKELTKIGQKAAQSHRMLVVLASIAFSVATYAALAYYFKPEPWTFCGTWKHFIAHWPEHRPHVPEEFVSSCDAWHQQWRGISGTALSEQEAQALVEAIILRCMEVRLGG